MSKIHKPEKSIRADSESMHSKQAMFQKYVINELESGTIKVLEDGEEQVVVKPILRKIAGLLSIPTFNSKGNPYNTRQLGTLIIRELIQP